MNPAIDRAARALLSDAMNARSTGHNGVRVDYMGLTDSLYVSISDGARKPVFNRQIALSRRPVTDVVADIKSARDEIKALPTFRVTA